MGQLNVNLLLVGLSRPHVECIQSMVVFLLDGIKRLVRTGFDRTRVRVTGNIRVFFVGCLQFFLRQYQRGQGILDGRLVLTKVKLVVRCILGVIKVNFILGDRFLGIRKYHGRSQLNHRKFGSIQIDLCNGKLVFENTAVELHKYVTSCDNIAFLHIHSQDLPGLLRRAVISSVSMVPEAGSIVEDDAVGFPRVVQAAFREPTGRTQKYQRDAIAAKTKTIGKIILEILFKRYFLSYSN
jgi:hypothetical protein